MNIANSTPVAPSKQCTKCKNSYPATPEFFTRHKRTKDGLNCQCKVCTYAKRREWYQANAEYAKAHHKIYYKNNLDHLRKYGYKQHEANREKERQQALERQKANPEQVKAANRRYRERRRKAEFEDMPFDKDEQLHRQNGRCFYCERVIKGASHIDHKTPLIRGGNGHPDNKVVTCPQCNLTKRDKTAAEFIEWRKTVGAE